MFAAAITALLLTFVWSGTGLFALIESAARDTPQAIAIWTDFAKGFGAPPREWLNDEIAAMQGPWRDQIAWRWDHIGQSAGPV